MLLSSGFRGLPNLNFNGKLKCSPESATTSHDIEGARLRRARLANVGDHRRARRAAPRDLRSRPGARPEEGDE